MKKILVSLLVLLSSSGLFADIFVQQNVTAPTLCNDLYLDWDFMFDNVNFYDNLYFSPVDSLSLGVFYEFDSGSTVHPFAGGEMGVYYYGFGILAGGGANITLVHADNFNFELNCSGNAGYLLDLFGGSHLITKVDCNFLFMPESRKGFFGGIGISNKNIIDMDIFWSQEIFLNMHTTLGFNLSAGYRF